MDEVEISFTITDSPYLKDQLTSPSLSTSPLATMKTSVAILALFTGAAYAANPIIKWDCKVSPCFTDSSSRNAVLSQPES